MISVLGAGAWGRALSLLLIRNGHQVRLYGRNLPEMQVWLDDQKLADQPKIQNLHLTADIKVALKACDKFLITAPCSAFPDIVNQISAHCQQAVSFESCILIWACKGFLPHGQLCSEWLAVHHPAFRHFGIISGPSFAEEVVQNKPTAMVLSMADQEWYLSTAKWFSSTNVRIYENPDLVGVQIGGAVKNVIAIASGICAGLDLGANARAALITRGLRELQKIAEAKHAKAETLMGLAGIGDLLLTCTDNQSRNFRFGVLLAQGYPVTAALGAIGETVEGYRVAEILHQVSIELHLDLPIINQIYRLLYQGAGLDESVSALLLRQSVSEFFTAPSNPN